MSEVKGRVGPFELIWKTIPSGPSGTAFVEATHLETREIRKLEVRWKRDPDGITIELPNGVYGFDLTAEPNDEGQDRYHVFRRGTGEEWQDLSFSRSGEESLAPSVASKKRGLSIRAQMPGKIIRVLAQPGASVEKGQALLVMEAMKMENEIQAPQSGVVKQVQVSEGKTVETGSVLCTLE